MNTCKFGYENIDSHGLCDDPECKCDCHLPANAVIQEKELEK